MFWLRNKKINVQLHTLIWGPGYSHAIVHKNSLRVNTINPTIRLAPVLKTIFHQCVISYTCSQSNSDGSVLKKEPSELDWLQVNDIKH